MVNKTKQYPKWIINSSIEKIPNNSITLIDDAHLHGLEAHEITKEQAMIDFMQRQKRHDRRGTFITTQDSTGLSLRVMRMLDCICVFKPNLMMLEYERPHTQVLFQKAQKLLEGKEKGSVYIYAQNWQTKERFDGVYTFKLPVWWNEEISESSFTGKRVNAYKKGTRRNIFMSSFNLLKTMGSKGK